MTTQMIIRLDENLKLKISQLARQEGKSASLVIRELIQNYVQERDMGSYIDDLWNRIGKKIKSRGLGPKEVKKAIKEVRAHKK